MQRRQADALVRKLTRALRDPRAVELLKPEYRQRVLSGAPPATGHCYIASEVLYHALGGKEAGCTPMFVRHEGEPHWFVRTPLGAFDPTADQFWTEPPYDEGVGKGFLTRAPSKRACALAEIASIDLPK